MRRAVVLSIVLCLIAVSSCSERLEILGPTPLGEGATIYIHANFAGSSQSIAVDVADLARTEGPCGGGEEGERPTWSDCISSIRVMSGWSVTLFRDRDFRGRSVTLTEDTPDLRDVPGPCDDESFNDCVSSIRVARR
jgi:hypothetical protein